MQRFDIHEPSDVFNSARVYLRLLREEDIDERYVSWFAGQPHMKHYGASSNTMGRQDLIDHLQAGLSTREYFIYGVFEKTLGQCIGNLRVGKINWAHGTSDLVVLIGDREHLGKGLGQEIIDVGNYLAFEQYGLRKLFGAVMESNGSSLKAYLRVGWFIEGIRKDQYVVDGVVEDAYEIACFKREWLMRHDRHDNSMKK